MIRVDYESISFLVDKVEFNKLNASRRKLIRWTNETNVFCIIVVERSRYWAGRNTFVAVRSRHVATSAEQPVAQYPYNARNI